MAYKWENGKVIRVSMPKKLSLENEKLANYYLNLIPQSFKIKENKDIWILFKL